MSNTQSGSHGSHRGSCFSKGAPYIEGLVMLSGDYMYWSKIQMPSFDTVHDTAILCTIQSVYPPHGHWPAQMSSWRVPSLSTSQKKGPTASRYTQNLGPQKHVKKLSRWQIFDEPNPSPRWQRKRQTFDDPENHVVKICQKFYAFLTFLGGTKTCHLTCQKLVKWQEKHWRVKICQTFWLFLTTLTTREILCVWSSPIGSTPLVPPHRTHHGINLSAYSFFYLQVIYKLKSPHVKECWIKSFKPRQCRKVKAAVRTN